MGSPGPQRGAAGGSAGGGRRCAGCGAVLAADNIARLCSRCHREQRDQFRTPPARLRDEFFETDEFRAAFESQHIGRVFKAYRNHPRHLRLFGRALNQELLGRWLGLSQAQVSKLENGKPEQHLETLRNYATILRLPQHLLWFDLPGQSRLKSPPASRDTDNLIIPVPHDDMLVAATGMDALIMGSGQTRVTHPSERSRGVDSHALRSLAHVLSESRRLEDSIGAAPLVQPLLAQLTLVEGLIIETSGSLRPEVVSIGSQYAQFAAWLHASTGNATAARQYYDRATEWALEADDANMVSTALSMKGHLAYRLGQLGPMLSLSQAAQRDKRLAPGIRALAVQQEARALALNGELEPCERKLDEAMELAGLANERPDDEPPWVYFYSPGYFTMQRGRAYLYLDMNDKAAELLDAGLAAMPLELRAAEWAQSYQADLDTARTRLS